MNHMKPKSYSQSAFTLVELMIVVVIIGLVAAISIPNMISARESSRNGRFIGDLRTANHSFIIYAMETGTYPSDETPGILPAGMSEYMGSLDWTEPTSIGGNWDWDYQVFGITAGVSVYRPSSDLSQLARIDSTIDDGDLGTGNFRSRADGYVSILE